MALAYLNHICVDMVACRLGELFYHDLPTSLGPIKYG